MTLYEEIAAEIQKASQANHKIAMLHFQVLKHAHQLTYVDPNELCALVGVSETLATEVRKMLALARLMDQEGMNLMHAPSH